MNPVSHTLAQGTLQMQLPFQPVIVFLSADQAMESLTIGRSKFYELIRQGMLPAGINVLGRSVRWVQHEIDVIKRHLAVNQAPGALVNLVASLQVSRCAPVANSRQLVLRGPTPDTTQAVVQPLTFLTEEQVRAELCMGRTKFLEVVQQGLVPSGTYVFGRSKRWIASELEWVKRLLVLGASTSHLQMTSRWMALWR